MKKIINYFKSTEYKENILPEVKRTLAVVFFTLIYGVGVSWFLEASVVPMYTGGIPGFAQVLRDFLVKYDFINPNNGDLIMSIFIFVANIPILLLGWFGISKRFTIYSLVSVIIQSVVIGFIPKVDFGLNSESQAIMASFIGGLLIGIGVGGALKYGTSTGGFDIIAQYFSFKKGHSVGFISMALNVLIAVLGALITGGDYEIAAGLIFTYTIFRIIITTVATDKIHTAYNYLEIQIITDNPEPIIETIMTRLGRGVTILKAEGAFSKRAKQVVMVIISSYELQNITDIINEFDEKSFVIAKPVRNVIGNFRKKRIA